MKMILFILHNSTKLPDLLRAWNEAGVGGATVLLSTGMGRIDQAGSLREDLPLMPSLSDFYENGEKLSRTVFSVVEDEATVTRVLAATQRVVGDLRAPDTGLWIVLPVERAEGLKKKHK